MSEVASFPIEFPSPSDPSSSFTRVPAYRNPPRVPRAHSSTSRSLRTPVENPRLIQCPLKTPVESPTSIPSAPASPNECQEPTRRLLIDPQRVPRAHSLSLNEPPVQSNPTVFSPAHNECQELTRRLLTSLTLPLREPPSSPLRRSPQRQRAPNECQELTLRLLSLIEPPSCPSRVPTKPPSVPQSSESLVDFLRASEFPRLQIVLPTPFRVSATPTSPTSHETPESLVSRIQS